MMDLRNIYDIYKEIDFEKKVADYNKSHGIDDFSLINFVYNLTSDFYGVIIEDFIKAENKIKELEEREGELKNIINENNCALKESVKTILEDNKFKVDYLYKDKSNEHKMIIKELGTIKDIIKGNKQEKLADYVGLENVKTRSWKLGINDDPNVNYSYITIQNLSGEDMEIPIKTMLWGPHIYGKLFYDDERKIFWMKEVNEDEYNGKRNELKEEFGEEFVNKAYFFVEDINKK